jgi:hypothetical protein
VSLEPGDFKTPDGVGLTSWKHADLVSLRAYHDQGGIVLGSKNWAGDQPKLRKVWWQGDGH